MHSHWRIVMRTLAAFLLMLLSPVGASEITLAGHIHYSPITNDNTLYLTIHKEGLESSSIVAIESGKILWQAPLQTEFGAGLAYANNQVFAHIKSMLDNPNSLSSYQANDGKHNYTRYLPKHAEWTDPVIANNKIYIVSGDDIYCFDTKTGRDVAKMQNAAHDMVETPIRANTALVMMVWRGLDLYDLETDKYQFHINLPQGSYFINSNINALPIFDASQNTVYGFYRNESGNCLHAFDLSRKSVKWISAPISPNAALIGNELYALKAFEQVLYSIDTATGQVNWQWTLDDPNSVLFEPVLTHNDLVFVQSNTKTYAISRTTHTSVWEIEKTGSMVLGKDVLYILHYNNTNDTTEVVTIPLVAN